jgi:hypothetical protein
MKQLRQFCLIFLMALALSIPAFAGDMQNGVTGETQFPGITGDMSGPGVTGDVLMPGIAGDMQFPSITGDIGFPGIIHLLMSLF